MQPPRPETNPQLHYPTLLCAAQQHGRNIRGIFVSYWGCRSCLLATHPAGARQTIAQALEVFLRRTHIRRVHFAQASVAPPVLAYITSFPRLSVPLGGKHPTEIAEGRRTILVPLTRGEVLFAGRNCWNKPDWSTAVRVLTFLFGKKQIGVS